MPDTMTFVIELATFRVELMPDIFQTLDLDSQLQETLKSQTSPLMILNTLIANEQYPAAIKFLALGLPPRQSIYWGYSILSEQYKEDENKTNKNALKLINHWIHDPDEDSRLHAKKMADQLTLQTPLGWLSTAVYWSAGNIAATTNFVIEPDPLMSGQAVSNAIMLTAHTYENPKESLAFYLKQCLDIPDVL